jgi:hypothetical protein
MASGRTTHAARAGVSYLTDEVSERDKRLLAQLTRDLDSLLQPPKAHNCTTEKCQGYSSRPAGWLEAGKLSAEASFA